MTVLPEANSETAAELLTTLREKTGRADLRYAGHPTALTGGFYAEMLRFRLADPGPELDRDLVARIVPDATAGAWEATIQRAVAAQAFPTPMVRLTADASGPLGRFLIVMDAVDGRPPMAGLGLDTILTQVPNLLRRLPDQLANVAADLHSLDPGPLASQIATLDAPFGRTAIDFVEAQVERARACGRADLVAAGELLVATEPWSPSRVIAHGDLHPFNLLMTDGGSVLVDWTVALVAHPAFTIAFTQLMLANPPVVAPPLVTKLLRIAGRAMSRRFVRTYRRRTDGTATAIDDATLDWHRKLHALRILVEMSTWEADGRLPPRGHPWIIIEPAARATLSLPEPGAPGARPR